MIYFDKKILFVCSLNSSLGDTINNVHAWIDRLKFIYPRSIIHAIFHQDTHFNVENILSKKGIIDSVYPMDCQSFNIWDNYNWNCYKRLLKNLYDIILFSPWEKEDTILWLKKKYPNAELLSADIDNKFVSKNILNYTEEKTGLTYHEYSRDIIKVRFSLNLTEVFVEECVSIAKQNGYEKFACLFGNSSRPLSNVESDGMGKVVETCNTNGFFCFVCGTTTANPYHDVIDWTEAHSKSYGSGSCNVVGIGWEKTIELMKRSDVVIAGPTGICMVPPHFGIRMIWIEGGNSPIMEGCLSSFTLYNNITRIKCNCPHFYCDKNRPGFVVNEKYNQCVEKRMPACLNSELNTEELSDALKTI